MKVKQMLSFKEICLLLAKIPGEGRKSGGALTPPAPAPPSLAPMPIYYYISPQYCLYF